MENVILEKVKDQFDKLKALSEELQVQMALGKAEARDLFEVERKNLSEYIRKQRKEMDNVENSSNHTRSKLLSSILSLESKLAADVPTESAIYGNYKNEILHKIFEIEELTKDIKTDVNVDLKKSLETFKVKMDAYRVNLALHDIDDPDKVDRVKADFSEKLNSVKAVLSNHENDQAKINHFVDDISKSYDYLKRAISDLTNE